jgi:hypothetical protein
MRPSEFDAAFGGEAPAVALRQHELKEPLRGDEGDQQCAFTH